MAAAWLAALALLLGQAVFAAETVYQEPADFLAESLPKIVVKGVEVKDPLGPYGAKGVGEISSIPISTLMALRRVSTPSTPSENSAAETTR